MATLISYHSSDGDKGRCDSRCYDAYGPDCHCVCQGVNHGKGLEQAKKFSVERMMKNLVNAYEEIYR